MLVMQVKSKMMGAILLVALLALAVFYFATTGVINKAFDKVENQNTRADTGRAVDALSNKTDQLETKATDWASWDDTYAFAVNHNAAYIKSNLQTGSLKNLGINYMLFFNDKQKLVHAKGIAVDTATDTATDTPVPADLLSQFQPNSKLLATSPDS